MLKDLNELMMFLIKMIIVIIAITIIISVLGCSTTENTSTSEEKDFSIVKVERRVQQ